MKRILEHQLNVWRLNDARKPLLLRGARKTGKTYLITEFAKTCFNGNAIFVDLSKDEKFHQLFKGAASTLNIISTLEKGTNKKFTPGKTLLFFDELKALPRAIHAIRRIAEEFRAAHVVVADSQLGAILQTQNVPLHAFQALDVQPLGFGEYLMAMGREDAAKIVLEKPAIISERMHEYLLSELRSYFLIGGFPESIKLYAESKKFAPCFEFQKKMIEVLLGETSGEDRTDEYRKCLGDVFSAAAHHIGEPIKYSDLGAGYSLTTLKNAFVDLCERHALLRVSSATPLAGPLVQSASTRQFKALMVDVGILQHLYGVHLGLPNLQADPLMIEQGKLAEQFVGQEMALAQGGELYFWISRVKESTSRVHYLVSVNGYPYPIGVVTENHHGMWDSIDCCLTTYPVCRSGMVFGRDAYKAISDKKCQHFPIYYAYCAAKSV